MPTNTPTPLLATDANDYYDMYKETVDPNYVIRDIVSDEDARLTSKTDMINLEYTTKQRKDSLLASITARNAAYYKMINVVSLVAIVVGVAGWVNLKQPSVIFDLLIMAVVGIGVVYLVLLYVEYTRRDKLDFNKIDSDFLVKPPVVDVSGTTTTTTGIVTTKTVVGTVTTDGTNVDITSSSTGCFGNTCCPAGSIFVDNQCTKKEGFFVGTIEPFTMNPKYNLI